MYSIHYYTETRHESRTTESLWAANLIAYKYVSQWGWDKAYVVDNTTGEILRAYTKN